MARKKFTTTFLQSLKAAPQGKREMHWDTELPHFGVRVSDSGNVSFVIVRRLGAKQLKRTLESFQAGKYPALDTTKEKTSGLLAKARARAREELADIGNKVDPKERRQKEEREKDRQRANTFASVFEDYTKRHLKKLGSGTNVERAIKRELIPHWGKRPITDIRRRDVIELVEKIVDSERPAVAHQILAYARGLFSWAIERSLYGLEASPCDRISAARVIGERVLRDRVLSDAEIERIWRATRWSQGDKTGLGYPFAPMVRLLLISGLRLREVAEMSWDEVDLDKALWTIPAKRMKGGEAHEVPLPPIALELLKSLPRWKKSYVFSTDGGETPVSGFSKSKIRLDKMLTAPEVEGGEARPALPHWTYHDLRRSMRTNLGGLPIAADIAELVIAHKRPGLRQVYDLHTYRNEKKRALELWEGRLRSIVEPAPANVVKLHDSRLA